MRLNFRAIAVVIAVVLATSALVSYFQVQSEEHRQEMDLRVRAQILAEGLEEGIQPLLQSGSRTHIQRIVERFGHREHLIGIAVYDRAEAVQAISSSLAARFSSDVFAPSRINAGAQKDGFVRLNSEYLYVYMLPMYTSEDLAGTLILVQDADYIKARSVATWRRSFLRLLIETLLIAAVASFIVRWKILMPLRKTALWMKALRTGKTPLRQDLPELFTPLRDEVTTLVESLTAARESAETEARLREAGEALWTAERLSVHVRSKLNSSQLFVVSNREPYTHAREGKKLKVLIPASGLVTALEPILRACEGTWIAHGSGDGDRETVDKHDRLRVPPDEPKYTLRRVWLTKQEEEGYYYGFANEGLWPLCHIAHTRPLFRAGDWEQYQKVNRRFAQAVLEEIKGAVEPVLLIQDYHFALLPKFIKEQRPDVRTAIFWHIPWPNPEAFGICPWQAELLEGLLAADLIGFHIQAHCDNFLETVNRALESRIEWERFAVNRDGHLTVVRPFPISVGLPEESAPPPDYRATNTEREALFKELGLEALYLGVGVDRVDYTKGILERFLGIEALLERHPQYRGKFSFVQIGAPSRTHIKRYHDFLAEVEAEAERINWRFQTDRWKPIIFLKRHHSHAEIERFYRTADLCMVTSLHDGMNLVAKEFVACRSDGEGALILSRFTGASRELSDALIVNPYDSEEIAEAIRLALEMEPAERHLRMTRMRQVVREQNIYRWAGNLIAGLCEIRPRVVENHKKRAQTPNVA